jgi:Leucine-rich repeat (LRR) protein
LVKCRVGDDGVRLLAAALSSNATLKTLDLRENKIGNDGAKILAAELEFDMHLTELNLSKNKIADDGARALALALRSNLWLGKLDISDNDVSDAVIPFFETTVENNLALTRYNGPKSDKITETIENKTMSADNSRLNCNSMKLATMTSPATTMAAVTYLNLFDNRLTEVPNWIPTLLPNLLTLIVARNQISSSGLRPIVELTSLTKLDVRVNRLETLPTDISRMTALRSLDASFNQIGTIPPTISQCTNLENLLLYDNQLEFIPSQMCKLTGLKTLDVRANSLKFVLDSALPKLRILNQKPHFEKLFQYLQVLGEGEPVKLSRCKLMLVGEANVGKSTQYFNALRIILVL